MQENLVWVGSLHAQAGRQVVTVDGRSLESQAARRMLAGAQGAQDRVLAGHLVPGFRSIVRRSLGES